MVVVERHGRVGAPAEAVWDVVRCAETLPRWLAGVARCEQDGDGHGARRRMTGETGAEVRARIIAYREPSLIAWRECADADAPGDPPPVPIARVSAELHVELRPDGDGTLVRLIRVHRPGGFWRGVALRLFGVRRIANRLDRSLAVLAAGRMRRADEEAPARAEGLDARMRRLDEGFATRMRRDGDLAARDADRGAGVPEPREPGPSVRGSGLVRRTVR
ncbi:MULTISPECIES: SRPBCC family protein [Catenuloplanes]|uniref:Uncharacterized protein YndB with AHSA1/START domain n=1 Tax=Catenuloplanes niger TaxID=587534 RepID=A0AAE3ZQ20_9ACTN|nr:SRPBCC family protein [Catenuloplanes niger]MDR7321810.1 uncharacterized protein YndB with AHSA1/START domain [Catenuloplanes niger]